jgi:hypothetical protein
MLGVPDEDDDVTHRLETFRAAELLFELLRRRRIDWQDLLMAGGVDPLEVEHREFLELVVEGSVIVILTEPL